MPALAGYPNPDRPFETQEKGGTSGIPGDRSPESAQGSGLVGEPQELADKAQGNGAPAELVETPGDTRKQTFDEPNAVMQQLKGQLTGSG
jgi:hypothetical protein